MKSGIKGKKGGKRDRKKIKEKEVGKKSSSNRKAKITDEDNE